MKKLLIIALLIVGCDEFAPTDHTHTQTQDVYGCTDAVATNFDSTATIFDNTCEYPFVFLNPTEDEIWCNNCKTWHAPNEESSSPSIK